MGCEQLSEAIYPHWTTKKPMPLLLVLQTSFYLYFFSIFISSFFFIFLPLAP